MEKEIKAKNVSLLIKVLDVVFLVVCAILKWLGIFSNCTIPEICLVGGTIGAVFGDISVNTALDKFTKKEGDEICG